MKPEESKVSPKAPPKKESPEPKERKKVNFISEVDEQPEK